MSDPTLNPLKLLGEVPPALIEYACTRALAAIPTWREKHNLKKAKKYAAKCADLLKQCVVSDFLFWYYGFDIKKNDLPLLRIEDDVYPLYTKPDWLKRTSVDEVLMFPLEKREYSLTLADMKQRLIGSYLKSLEATGRTFYDAQTYRLLEIRSTEFGFKLHCGSGRYKSYLGTCEVMSDELLHRLYKSNIAEISGLKNRLKNYAKLSEDLPSRFLLACDIEQLAKLTERDSKLGINVFLVINTEDEPICFIQHRSKTVAEYPDIEHVMPAGTFQHDSKADLNYPQLIRAYSVKYKVLSELWEECFEGKDYKAQRKMQYEGVIDLDNCSIPDKPELFPIRDVTSLLAKDKAYMFVTGIGIDLLAAKPELSILLVIDDRQFAAKYRDYWKVNWEFQGYANGTSEGVHFIRLNETRKIRKLIRPGYVIPAGAMAVSQGFKVLSALAQDGRLGFSVPDWPNF